MGALYYSGAPYAFDTVDELMVYAKRTLADEASLTIGHMEFAGDCTDEFRVRSFPHLSFATWQMLQAELGNTSVNSCKDLEYICFHDNDGSRLARYYCPETCGLHDIRKGQYFDRRQDGSPLLCEEWNWYDMEFKNPCTELPAAALRTYEPWLNYIEGITRAILPTLNMFHFGNETKATEIISEFTNGMLEFGCAWFLDSPYD